MECSEARELLLEFAELIVKYSEYSKGKKPSYPSSYKNDIPELYRASSRLEGLTVPADESQIWSQSFQSFLRSIYDAVVVCDHYLRSICYKIFRHCLKSEGDFDVLVSEGFHVLISGSFESEESKLDKEKDQALKIIVAFLTLSPRSFPLCFARSIVALCAQSPVTNPQNNSDFFRNKVRESCLDLLCELCFANTNVLAKANGISIMIEVILDKDLSHLHERFLLTLLHVLSKPSKRKFINPDLDFRQILSPLLDVNKKELSEPQPDFQHISRREASLSAFMLMMKTYVGIIQLCSDEMAFPYIVKMLRDPNIPLPITNMFIDSITELFHPFTTTLRTSSRSTTSPLQFAQSSEEKSIGLQQQQQNLRQLSANGISIDNITFNVPAEEKKTGSGRSALKANSASSIEEVKSNKSDKSDKKSSGGQWWGGITRLFSPTSTKLAKEGDSKGGSGKDKIQINDVIKAATDVPTGGGSASSKSSVKSNAPTDTKTVSYFSPHFDKNSLVCNLTDNYCAFLCCAFIHTDLLSSLCYIAVKFTDSRLIDKSRRLLIGIFRTISVLFPVSLTSELLVLPSLVLTNTFSRDHPHEAERADKILQELSDVFSITSTKFPPFVSGERLAAVSPLIVSDRSGEKFLSSICKNATNISRSRVATILYSQHQNMSTAMGVIIRAAPIELKYLTEKFSTEDKHNIPNPSTWNWAMINEVLAHKLFMAHNGKLSLKDSKQNDERSLIKMQGKVESFILQLHPFFTIISPFKQYGTSFSTNLWDPSKFHLVECMTNMYHVFLENGLYSFGALNGKLTIFTEQFHEQLLKEAKYSHSVCKSNIFEELSNELDDLLDNTRPGPMGSEYTEKLSLLKNAKLQMHYFGEKNVFRRWSCIHTMSREYFTILGRLVSTKAGTDLVDAKTGEIQNNVIQKLVQTLRNLGDKSEFLPRQVIDRNLEYLCRLVITSLSFSDNGAISPKLFSSWFRGPSTSASLKEYMISLLMVLLQSRPMYFYKWGCEILIEFIRLDPGNIRLYEILEVACNDSVLMHNILATLPRIDEALGEKVLIRCASSETGITYLNNMIGSHWLPAQIKKWLAQGAVDYVDRTENALSNALMRQRIDKIREPASLSSADPKLASPIEMNLDVFSTFSVSKSCLPQLFAKRQVLANDGIFSDGLVKLPATSPLVTNADISNNVSAVDLEGLMQCPWNIEANIVSKKPAPFAFDTFLDVSGMKHPCIADSNDSSRLVLVRGIVDTSDPVKAVVTARQQVQCVLSVGAFAVKLDGSVESFAEYKASVDGDRLIDRVLNARSQTDINKSFYTCTFDNSEYMCAHGYSKTEPFYYHKPGEPVIWKFVGYKSKHKEGLLLQEIQYVIRIRTPQAHFTPLPRHLFGELVQSEAGIKLLSQSPQDNVFEKVVKHIHDNKLSLSSREDIAVLLSLGKLCSSDHGLAVVNSLDSDLIGWLVSSAVSYPDYSIRGVLFNVLGQVSRCKSGAKLLLEGHKWASTSTYSVSPVAVPKIPSILFCTKDLDNVDDDESTKGDDNSLLVSQNTATSSLSNPTSPIPSRPHAHVRSDSLGSESTLSLPRQLQRRDSLSSRERALSNEAGFNSSHDFLDQLTPESAYLACCKDEKEASLLNQFVKLCGVGTGSRHMNSESILTDISNFAKTSSLFSNRRCYLAVQYLFEVYSFDISYRRSLLKLFTSEAKVKWNPILAESKVTSAGGGGGGGGVSGGDNA